MKFSLPIKKGTTIYTIEGVKMQEYKIKGIRIHPWVDGDLIERDISVHILLLLERHNDGVNFYETEKPLSECFFTQEDLINQLNKS